MTGDSGAVKERATISDTTQYSPILTRLPWDLAEPGAVYR